MIKYMVRDGYNKQYHVPKYAYPAIEDLLKTNTPPKKVGGIVKDYRFNYHLDDIKHYNTTTMYYFTKIAKER